MSKNEWNLLEELFKDILDSLVQNPDGTYTFKEGKLSRQATIIIDSNLFKEESEIISTESICKYFEDNIVSKIPHATLIISGNISIEVNIGTAQRLIQRILNAKKQLDIYESFKTLFFPTLKERLLKYGKSPAKWIYIPGNKYKVEVYPLKDDPTKKDIRFVSSSMIRYGFSDKLAIELLMEDINYYIRNLKFHNPLPIDTTQLPQKDLSIQDLKSKIKGHRKGGFWDFEYYSYKQKIEFIKQLFRDFLDYYPKIIEKNFQRIKNSFLVYSNQPIKIAIYTREHQNPYNNSEDPLIEYSIEKLNNNSENQIELLKNQELEYDENYLYAEGSDFSHYLNIRTFFSFTFSSDTGWETSGDFKYPEISKLNALPFTYSFIYRELGDIIEKIAEDTIFDEIKPYVSPVESWINAILEAEKRGGEDYNIELKLIPTESKKGDGSGNDIYGQINAFENTEGGYIFLGIDENKKKIEKIVGLNSYLSKNNKDIDQLKREIQEKCLKYLYKTYTIHANEYKGKKLIRISVPSNNGDVSYFHTISGDSRVYIRLNGKKHKLSPNEINERYKKFYGK